MNPSAAIVIPCWNGEAFIGRAIASAQTQTWPDLEIIVVDDGSDDGSLDVIRGFGQAIRWSSGPNAGASAARNRGLGMTHADYVLFLDADDYLEPDSLSQWLETAQRHDADVVFGPFAISGAAGMTRGIPPHPPASAFSILCEWLEGRFTPPCAVLWRGAFLKAIGGWNAAGWDRWALRNDDGELAMRAMILGARAATAEAGLGVYVQHTAPGRISHRSDAAVFACELSVLENLWALAKEQGIEPARPSFARAFYRIAYGAYAIGADQTGRAALAEARALGFSGHIGSATHRLASRALGLRRKMRLAAMARSALGAPG